MVWATPSPAYIRGTAQETNGHQQASRQETCFSGKTANYPLGRRGMDRAKPAPAYASWAARGAEAITGQLAMTPTPAGAAAHLSPSLMIRLSYSGLAEKVHPNFSSLHAPKIMNPTWPSRLSQRACMRLK